MGAKAVLHFVTCSDETMRTRALSRTAEMPEGALYIDENALNELRTRFEPLDADELHLTIRTDERESR